MCLAHFALADCSIGGDIWTRARSRLLVYLRREEEFCLVVGFSCLNYYSHYLPVIIIIIIIVISPILFISFHPSEGNHCVIS